MVTYVVIGGSTGKYILYCGTDEETAKKIFANSTFSARYEMWVNGRFYEEKVSTK